MQLFKNQSDEEELNERINELEAQAERMYNAHQRTVQKLNDEINQLKSLEYSHADNIRREHELDERERDLNRRVDAFATAQEADERVRDVKHESRTARLDEREKSIYERECQLKERESKVADAETDKENANLLSGYANGYAEGHRDGVASMRTVIDKAHELLKVHAIGVHLPKTATEDEENPLAVAYGELGANLVQRLVGESEEE
jgi:uncharacterized protein (DUF3084 family)